ncbi:leucine-rich repeat domain-containing protein [Butyrivibrio sp. AE2032]|uniref:leucine-rich repeat domain-containing protein n=1 Tax=Butyrivibrio sp. AE2032 TaxID=1458463 RepID=UPI0005539627|nr:leucine-rich repeat domain-containing protein [Butyrivibrio sp. AE2032]
MKKAFASVFISLCILVSMFNSVLAFDESGYCYIGGDVYLWRYTLVDRMYGYLELIRTNETSFTPSSFESHSDKIDQVSVYNPHSDPETFVMPSSLKQVHDISFTGNYREVSGLATCTWLEKITIENNQCKYIKLDMTGINGNAATYLPEIKTIGTASDCTVYFCLDKYDGPSNVIVPSKFTGTNPSFDYSFCDSNAIRKVSFENGTTKIPELAFYNCKNLSSVTLPSGLSSIEYSAFKKCTNLKSITIPGTIKSIGFNAFTGSGLESIKYYGDSGKWMTLVKEIDSSETLIGTALHLDGTVVHCNDGDIVIRKTDNGYMDKYINVRVGWFSLGNGKWMFFDNDGKVFYNKIATVDGHKYAFDDQGVMITGWAKFNNKWYFFNKSGIMATGWLNNNNKWFYLSSDGSMVTGWQKIGGKWYFFNSEGAMVTGWKQIEGYYYFFKSDGSMAANEFCSGYWLELSGKWLYKERASWKKDSKGWYYQDTSGWYAKNATYKIDGKNYNFNSEGYCTNP